MEHCISSGEASLVVLAAGLGKRFGGGKQLASIGRTGKPLMYFNVMDAWRAGVRRLVLVINAEIRPKIENDFIPLLPAEMQIALVEQRGDDIPAACSVQLREKPWGTAHALWCARTAVSGHCFVINADDYYGPDSFACLLEHFETSPEWAMVAFPLQNTLSENGAVSRGLCEVRGDRLVTLRECHAVLREGDKIYGELGGETIHLEPDMPVSMNIWGLGPDIFEFLERGLVKFFSDFSSSDKRECYLPELVMASIKSEAVQVNVYNSNEPWYGITYLEDLEGLGEVFDAYE